MSFEMPPVESLVGNADYLYFLKAVEKDKWPLLHNGGWLMRESVLFLLHDIEQQALREARR